MQKKGRGGIWRCFRSMRGTGPRQPHDLSRPPRTGETPLGGLFLSHAHLKLGKCYWLGSPQVPPTLKQRNTIGRALPNSHINRGKLPNSRPPQTGEPPLVGLFPTPTHPKLENHHWSGSPQAPPLPNLGSCHHHHHHHPRNTPRDTWTPPNPTKSPMGGQRGVATTPQETPPPPPTQGGATSPPGVGAPPRERPRRGGGRWLIPP